MDHSNKVVRRISITNILIGLALLIVGLILKFEYINDDVLIGLWSGYWIFQTGVIGIRRLNRNMSLKPFTILTVLSIIVSGVAGYLLFGAVKSLHHWKHVCNVDEETDPYCPLVPTSYNLNLSLIALLAINFILCPVALCYSTHARPTPPTQMSAAVVCNPQGNEPSNQQMETQYPQQMQASSPQQSHQMHGAYPPQSQQMQNQYVPHSPYLEGHCPPYSHQIQGTHPPQMQQIQGPYLLPTHRNQGPYPLQPQQFQGPPQQQFEPPPAYTE